MTQICKGICQRYEAPKTTNRLRYKNGEKNAEYVIDFLSQINGDVSAVTQH